MSETTENVRSALTFAITCTMESMTFEEVEVVDEAEVQFTQENLLWSMLPINKPRTGQLVIQVAKEHGMQLTEEVFGFPDDAITDTMVTDLLAEFANTVAGRFMGKLVPDDTEFELGLPSTGKGDYKQSNIATVVPLRVGEHAMRVSVMGKDFVTPANQ